MQSSDKGAFKQLSNTYENWNILEAWILEDFENIKKYEAWYALYIPGSTVRHDYFLEIVISGLLQ